MTDRAYRPDVDGLRGVAILAVVAFHGFPGWVGGGFIGVDVFFVISGFLITGIIVGGLERQEFSFAHFYARRVRRLFPALIVVLAACWAIGWFRLLPPDLVQLGRHVTGGAGFVANFVFWNEAWYFDTAAAAKPLLHLWSLGVEEQFYLFWPLMLVVVWSIGRRHVIGTTALIAAASLAWSISEIPDNAVAAFYSPASRMWELLAGALLALRPLRLLEGNATSVLGTTLIVASAFVIEADECFPGWYALAPVVGTVLVLAAGPQAVVNRVVLSWRPMLKLGLISYPLYLWHWPLLSFAFIAGHEDSEVALRSGLLALSVVLAWATWRLVEAPIRRGGPSTAKVVGLSAAMTGVAAIAWLGVAHQGFPGRFAFPPAIDRLAMGTYELVAGARYHTCWLDGEAPADGFAPECRTPSRPAGETIVLWGDSYAARLHPGLPEALQFTRNACPPLLMVGTPGCHRDNAFVLEEIARLKPGTVVLFSDWAGNWAMGHGSWKKGGYFARQLGATLDALKAAGVARIVVLGPPPQWVRMLSQLLVTRWIGGDREPVIPDRTTHGLRSWGRAIEQVMRDEVDRHGATYVSLLDLLCNEDGCLVQTGGELTSWDTGHFTVPAAKLVAAELEARRLVP